MRNKSESNGLISILILARNVFMNKTKPLVSKYGVMVVHLDYGDLIMRIQWLNTFGPILQDFSKLQMKFSVNGKLLVLRGDKPIGIRLINMPFTLYAQQGVQL